MKTMLALFVVSLCAACGSSPTATDENAVSTESSALQSQAVSGGWSNSTPCNTTFFDPNTGKLKCDGFTDWTGSFTGSSHYFFTGKVNLTTGDIAGLLNETFTGRGLGTSGTFHMDETMTISASTGAIDIHAVVDHGTGGFDDHVGLIHFVGTSDTSGIGNGTYSGKIWSR